MIRSRPAWAAGVILGTTDAVPWFDRLLARWEVSRFAVVPFSISLFAALISWLILSPALFGGRYSAIAASISLAVCLVPVGLDQRRGWWLSRHPHVSPRWLRAVRAVHAIGSGDCMAERLDLAYAINVHVAQGVTTEYGIVAMRSSEQKLLTERSFLVALIRVADKVALVLDDGRKVERNVTRNTDDKTSPLDVVERGRATGAIQLPDMTSPLDKTLERYAQLILAAEPVREDGRGLSVAEMRELASTAAALDQVRLYAAEGLRIVLDRSPGPVRSLEQAALLSDIFNWLMAGTDQYHHEAIR